MKHILLVAIIIGIGILTRAQTEYEVSGDGRGKVLKGLLTRDLLTGDAAFGWFTENRAGYTPDPGTVATLRAKKGQVQFLVFGGTWDDDTKFLLPRFISLMDAASIPETQLTLVGVDRNEKTTGHLSEDLHVTGTPTFIILKDGREVGRVVRYGRNGQWEKEIADIVTSSF